MDPLEMTSFLPPDDKLAKVVTGLEEIRENMARINDAKECINAGRDRLFVMLEMLEKPSFL